MHSSSIMYLMGELENPELFLGIKLLLNSKASYYSQLTLKKLLHRLTSLSMYSVKQSCPCSVRKAKCLLASINWKFDLFKFGNHAFENSMQMVNLFSVFVSNPCIVF